MGITSRLMNASRAFLSSWRTDNIPPSSKLGWDHYSARVARIAKFRRQYNNRDYDDPALLIDPTGRRSLGKTTAGVTNPVTSIVDLYPTLCAGGPIDYDGLKVGAMPVTGADDKLIEAIIQMLLWSNWAIEKSTFVRNGALTGDTVIKLVDYPARHKVSAEVIPTEFIKDAERDASGNVKSYIIEYDLEEEVIKGSGNLKTYTYTETCDKESFKTYKDGKPFAFIEDENGNMVSEWPNIYGFVPLVIVPHKRISGLQWGVNAYYHAIPKIDAMNDLASILIDYARRAMAPSWLFNFDKPKPRDGETKSNLDLSVNGRDQERVIYAPETARAQSLVHPADVAATQGLVVFLDSSVTKDCPERALPDLRASGNLTAPGVQAAFKDGEGRIMEAQANYDNGTVRWIQMGITMAAVRRYDKFTQYDISSYDQGALDFYIKPRPVIEDKLSKLDEIREWQTSGIDEKVWGLLGATDEEIERFKLFKQQKAMLELMMKQQQPPALPNGNAPAQLGAGQTPTIKGAPLPSDQATADTPITPEQVAAWNLRFSAMDKVIKP